MQKTTLIFSIIIILLASCAKKTSSTHGHAKVPHEGLMAEYLLNGNANDSSPNTINGVVSGATPTANRKNELNSAYSFDGVDDFIRIPNSPFVNFKSDDNFTLSLWVAVAKIQSESSGEINDILDKWRGDTQGYPYGIRFWNSNASKVDKERITFVRYDGSVCRNFSKLNSPILEDENFHHVVQVKSAGLLKLYFDNLLVSEMADNITCKIANDADVTFGMRGQGVRYFTGKIDDVRFYNRALDEHEITALFKE